MRWDRFVGNVLANPKITLIGGKRVLREVAEVGGTRRHQARSQESVYPWPSRRTVVQWHCRGDQL